MQNEKNPFRTITEEPKEISAGTVEGSDGQAGTDMPQASASAEGLSANSLLSVDRTPTKNDSKIRCHTVEIEGRKYYITEQGGVTVVRRSRDKSGKEIPGSGSQSPNLSGGIGLGSQVNSTGDCISKVAKLGNNNSSPRMALETDMQNVDLNDNAFPPVDNPDACDKAALRLRAILRKLSSGDVALDVLTKNLEFAVQVLEYVYLDDTRCRLNSEVTSHLESLKRFAEEEDDLSEVQPDAVPQEVREWLASTFTRQTAATKKRTTEKPKFRSVAQAIRAGIFVDRIYRRMSTQTLMQYPPHILTALKTIDRWNFDCFEMCSISNNQAIKYVGYDLLNRYGLIHKYKIPPSILESFLSKVEDGYMKFGNPYHNNIHSIDVTQTVHYMLCQTGLVNWLTDLEIFATLFAALIHDYEHTGTTNNFHVQSVSDIALMYNDRAVLENHHISATFRLLHRSEEGNFNILQNLSRDEYREFRSLVIDMVLATDMSYHFAQLKAVKNVLQMTDSSLDKSKVLSMMLHCCDISHPSKPWDLHVQWTNRVIEEFFLQGDREAQLGLPFSPLCDRKTTLIAESQIGFIDFIVDPTMQVCGDLIERVLHVMTSAKSDENICEEAFEPGTGKSRPAGSVSSITSTAGSSRIASRTASVDSATSDALRLTPLKSEFQRPWAQLLIENKQVWKKRAQEDAEQRAKLAAEEDVVLEEEEARMGEILRRESAANSIKDQWSPTTKEQNKLDTAVNKEAAVSADPAVSVVDSSVTSE